MGGGPWAHVLVGLFSAGGSRVTSLPLDAFGERVWEELPAGDYYLVWSDPAFGVGGSSLLTLQGGENLDFARQLPPPALVSLHCGDETCRGQAVEALSVVTAAGFDLAPHLAGFSPGLTFSADGELSLGPLSPGEYHVLARVGGVNFDLPVRALPNTPVELYLAEPRKFAAAGHR